MHTRKTGLVALGFALALLTTPSYGQTIPQIGSVGTNPNGSPLVVGPPHNVIYWPGQIYDSVGNDIGQTLIAGCDPINGPAASGCYTDVIIFSVFPNSDCSAMIDGTDTGIVDSGLLGNIVQQLQYVGKTVLLSVGGPTPSQDGTTLTSKNYQSCYYNNMSGLVNALVNYVNKFNLDGIDIDYEDTDALYGNAGYDGIDFLTQLTTQIFNQLPQYHNIITHAPQTMYWMQPANYTGVNGAFYTSPPYAHVWYNTQSAHSIAWFNHQFYDDGTTALSDKVANYVSIVNNIPLSPQLLVFGLLIGANAGSDVSSAIAQLQGYYPNQFGGVMGWSAANDNATWNSLVWNALTANQVPWYAGNVPTGQGCLNGGSSVTVTTCDGGAFPTEFWKFSAKAIINTVTQQCLDAGQPGLTLACNGGNYQNWQFFGNSNGGAGIISQQSLYQQLYNGTTPYCLDSGQTPAYFPCNLGLYQSWWGGSE